MIVRTLADELWLFDQDDHAALCGEMADAWGAPPFGPAPEAARLAARTHDSGWPEWDRAPRLDRETGRPHPYSHMPPEDYLAVWRRGLARGWGRGEGVGLLVSLHAMRFFGRREGAEDRALLARERALEAEALAALGAAGVDPEALPEPYATWHAWVFFWDALSLFLCEGWSSPWSTTVPATAGGERVEVRVEVRAERPEEGIGGRVRVDPFPFVRALRLEAPARVVPAREYRAQAELDEAVSAAERRNVVWRLLPDGA